MSPVRRRLPPEQRAEQVLDAAVRVFSRAGFHDASMDAVAEAAGVSKPMVYTHGGGSKDELLRRCIRREADRLLRSVSGAAADVPAGTDGAEDRLRRGLRAFFATLTTHRDGWSVLYRQARTGTVADEVQDARARIVDRVAELLTAEFGAPGAPGARSVTAPVAAALVGAAEGLADWSASGGTQDPDELAAMALALLWPGLDRLRSAG
ncbi:TetR/AcrR family transcriptional regulator [Pseudonocardia sp. HH130630-07]|uniref:TetR/AcrR family transcriptional regulator n=1 Tax=Pseudonocardia sp. HH130630-07 TaxID=1690815 RepID=UPI000814C54C|nr:TetR/AcrR family transcriptional regulator [Pseudonocardia sp. HH130630-07]ANY06734.1 hypothetical protein AFB00_11015 [Pseudonocardia sp. HH130630-07]